MMTRRRPFEPFRVALVVFLAGVLIAAGSVSSVAHGARLDTATPIASPTAASAEEIAALTETLMRSGLTGEGFVTEIILGAPAFFVLTDRWQQAVDLGADRILVFIINRHHHGALDGVHDHVFTPILRLDGTSMHVPSEIRLMSEDGHNRTNAFIYGDLPVTLLDEDHQIELLLPPAPDGTRPVFQWFTPIESAAGTPIPVTGYAHPEMLAETGWLRERLGDPGLKVVALTPPEDFAAGHIPGAVQIDWPGLEVVETSDQAVATWRGEVEGTLTALGIAPADTVVVYDGGTFLAARFWWVLHQLGHADVRLLDGGFPAWTADGGAIKTGSVVPEPAAQPYVGTPDEADVATRDEAIAGLNDPTVIFVDARPAEAYAAGHIPGAVNLDSTENALSDQPRYWKSAAELRALYAAVGATPDKTIVPYCAAGVRSAATFFALRLIGYENVSLYTGSWNEWSAHPELPVATGSAPGGSSHDHQEDHG
jgi:thiosulfate/3-mercaptopyruvate sulfurtransferase